MLELKVARFFQKFPKSSHNSFTIQTIFFKVAPKFHQIYICAAFVKKIRPTNETAVDPYKIFLARCALLGLNLGSLKSS